MAVTHKILFLLIAISLVQGFIYSAIIPPWQAPDEPRHFEYVKLLYEKRRLVGWGDVTPSVEQEIIASIGAAEYEDSEGVAEFVARPSPLTLCRVTQDPDGSWKTVIAEGKNVTYDMKPHRDDPSAVGTGEMADAIPIGGCRNLSILSVVRSVHGCRNLFSVSCGTVCSTLKLVPRSPY